MALVDESDTRNMVLRTVFFPPDLDDRLRDVAFSNRVSKGDLIRALVVSGLATIAPEVLVASRPPKKHVATKKKVKKKAAAKRALSATNRPPIASAKKATKKVAKKTVK